MQAAEVVGLADVTSAEEKACVESPTIVPWRERIEGSIARSRKVRGGNFVQIATVDHEGAPRCRTVVFRGFLKVAERGEAGEAMKFITDARSEKVSQAASTGGKCEVCWWFSKSSEQYRVAGTLEFVGPEKSGGEPGSASEELLAHRKQAWGNLSDNAREQFYWGGQPGAACGEAPPPDTLPPGGRDADGKVLPPPDTFFLVLLYPEQVKYLRLTDNFSQLDRKAAEGASGGEWSAVRVFP
mmetsp:Transcript_57548/g.130401  ORF Transcript_57548/g.130401 Transcript_57548/m.130401 type:complete len:241 (-) Transcript_57548:365-1087(-)